MKRLKITVLSGGSGNDAILKGIKYYYPECDLKVITNAYDNGKSTGQIFVKTILVCIKL